MRLLSFICLFSHIFAGQVFTKIIHTPVYDSNQLCKHHHVVLIQDNPFIEDQCEYNRIYAVYFSPDEDISDPIVIFRMIMGKDIKAKVRVVYLDHLNINNIIYNPLNNCELAPIESIIDLDLSLYCAILQWEPVFQLYNRNCQHFSHYLCKKN